MASIPGVGLISRFFGRTISEGAAFAIGTATGPALRPLTQEVTNEAWTLHPVRPPDAGTLALGVAQGQVDPDAAAHWAMEQGLGGAQFKALVDIANTGPGVPIAFDLWRRGQIDETAFRRAVKRQGLEAEWINDLIPLKDVRLDPAVIANAVQQGHVPPGSLLPPPVTGAPPFHIPLTTIDLDPLAEWAAHGVDEPRGKILANLVGLPPGDIELLHMWNRGIIDEDSVEAGIREGHRKTKWIPAVKELRHAVLTAIQATNLRLRAWITDDQMYALGAKTGYSRETMDLLLKGQGRPLTFHQVFVGLRRGGVYNGPVAGIAPAFLKSLQESNIRPEWYSLAWAQRHTFPSAFVLRALVQGGDLTGAEGEAILLDIGWREDLAKTVAAKWALGGAASAKALTKTELASEYEGLYITEAQYIAALEALGYAPDVAQMEAHVVDSKRVAKARDQVVTRIHAQYVGHKIAHSDAAAYLDREGIPAPALGLILTEWDHEREVNRAVLTPAEIVNAFRRSIISESEALSALEDRGYSPTDAAARLGVQSPVLTVKQIKDAVAAGLLSNAEAVARLMLEGYSAADAAILLAE